MLIHSRVSNYLIIICTRTSTYTFFCDKIYFDSNTSILSVHLCCAALVFQKADINRMSVGLHKGQKL